MSEINRPAAPGEGPLGTPTPALPPIDQPASSGEGPLGTPTPSLPPIPPTPSQPFIFRCPTGYTAGQVQRGQSFADLLLQHNVSYNAMRAANPNLSTTNPGVGSLYCAPPEGSRRMCTYGSRSYVMGQGETLYTLLRTLNTTAAVLLRVNPDLAPGDFLPGRVICLP